MFQKLFKTLSIYTFSNILNAAIPFLLLPFLTKYLTPSDYALVDLFFASGQFFIAVIGLNTFSALSRFYFDSDQKTFDQYISQTLFIISFTGGIILLFVEIFNIQISNLIHIPKSWLWTIVIYATTSNIIQTQLIIWQVRYKAIYYGLFRVSRTLFDIVLSIGLILLLHFNWEGRILGQTIIAIIFAIFSFFLIVKHHRIAFKWMNDKTKDLILYGSPLILHILGTVIITYSDRLFISNYIDLKSTGIYAVGYQVGMIIYLIQNSFNQAWTPWFFEKLKSNDEDEKGKIVKFTYYYFIALIILAFLVAKLAPLLFSFYIDNAYSDGQEVVIWIALAFAFNGMYKMMSNYIFYSKKTYIVSIITVITAIINLILNYFWVKNYGAIGVAKATTISFFIQFLLTWIYSNKTYKMNWLLVKTSKSKND